MINIFNRPLEHGNATISSPRFEKEKSYLNDNLERVVSHYRRQEYAVRSDHLLVQLLQSLPIRGDQSIYELHREVEDKAPELARAFRLFSSATVGEVSYPGVFLGLDGYELIIFEDTYVDVIEAEKHWQELEPVTFLTHAKWDLNMEVPDGSISGMGSGIAVIHIHPVKLAIQYKKWREREHYLNKDFQRNMMQFVYAYPLSNAIRSSANVSLYNLLRRRFYDVDSPQVDNEHKFFINVRYSQIEKTLDRFLLDAMRQRINFEEFINSTTLLQQKTIQNVVGLPSFLKTQQVTWALVAARLPTIEFMLEWNRISNATENRQINNEVRRELKRLKTNRTVNSLMSLVSDELTSRIEKNIAPFV